MQTEYLPSTFNAFSHQTFLPQMLHCCPVMEQGIMILSVIPPPSNLWRTEGKVNTIQVYISAISLV